MIKEELVRINCKDLKFFQNRIWLENHNFQSYLELESNLKLIRFIIRIN